MSYHPISLFLLTSVLLCNWRLWFWIKEQLLSCREYNKSKIQDAYVISKMKEAVWFIVEQTANQFIVSGN